jgi:hypothetical protein
MPVSSWSDHDRRLVLARRVFEARVARWLGERGGRFTLPDDRAVLIALGVPCEDCLEVVTEDGADGHQVQVWRTDGPVEPSPVLLVARCGQTSGPPMAEVST